MRVPQTNTSYQDRGAYNIDSSIITYFLFYNGKFENCPLNINVPWEYNKQIIGNTFGLTSFSVSYKLNDDFHLIQTSSDLRKASNSSAYSCHLHIKKMLLPEENNVNVTSKVPKKNSTFVNKVSIENSSNNITSENDSIPQRPHNAEKIVCKSISSSCSQNHVTPPKTLTNNNSSDLHFDSHSTPNPQTSFVKNSPKGSRKRKDRDICLQDSDYNSSAEDINAILDEHRSVFRSLDAFNLVKELFVDQVLSGSNLSKNMLRHGLQRKLILSKPKITNPRE